MQQSLLFLLLPTLLALLILLIFTLSISACILLLTWRLRFFATTLIIDEVSMAQADNILMMHLLVDL